MLAFGEMSRDKLNLKGLLALLSLALCRGGAGGAVGSRPIHLEGRKGGRGRGCRSIWDFPEDFPSLEPNCV